MYRLLFSTRRQLQSASPLSSRSTAFRTGRVAPRFGVCRRHLATPADAVPQDDKAQEPSSDKTEKPKSKAKPTASLRRAASASLPIRANPTPTRGRIQPVFTVSTAKQYAMDKLGRSLPLSARMLPLPSEGFEEAWWIPEWGKDPVGEVFVFRNGSYVCWGLEEKEALRFGDDMIKDVKGVEIGPLQKLETEELDFVTDPSEQTRLQGDLIILGSRPSVQQTIAGGPDPTLGPIDTLVLARFAFSQALARSSALSALESSLDEYLSSVAGLPESLSATGELGYTRTELTKKLGQLLKFRAGVNLTRENFQDTPDFYWTEPELEGYFDSVSKALEIRPRMHSVNSKITYAAETQEVLRQLLTDATAHRMELIIIALIAVEATIAVVRDGPELWHMLVG